MLLQGNGYAMRDHLQRIVAKGTFVWWMMDEIAAGAKLQKIVVVVGGGGVEIKAAVGKQRINGRDHRRNN
jgi:hypothetical protein